MVTIVLLDYREGARVLIEFIQGELQIKGPNYIVIQVGGIGYRLFTSSFTLAKLPPVKEEVTVFTYLHVREDELSLYGFLSNEEKKIFVTLLQVSGIGPKLALAILSHLSGSELCRAIVHGDTQTLLTIPGVGKKTAGRIVLELKDKLQKEVLPEEELSEIGSVTMNTDARSEAISALLALGYSVAEAQKAVPVSKEGQDYSVEDLIRMALKQIGK
ncbi:MAG: Holliday junction branch migration protein RuvA [Clostridia bacterium]|jgi:Holliday junction DNA helicase RuvA|nr:Holliday junction branch migration protein RuvA [Clostridia bacterium]